MESCEMIDLFQQNLDVDQIRYLDILNVNHRKEMIRDVRYGLNKSRKCLSSKYLYDSRGSLLFDRITMTAEYYLTRSEISILDRSVHEIIEFLSGEGGDIVELGSGSTTKIKKLLDAAYANGIGRVRYIPMDICGNCVESVLHELAPLYPGLELLGLRADFTSQLHVLPQRKKLIVFFGSTIGNFAERECTDFLRGIARIMNPDDRLLIGMDMIKPVRVLEMAYNDSEGMTRDFNLNILLHINRELRANFKLDDFQHKAFFNAGKQQIEMHLLAKRAVSAWISDLSMAVTLREGETVRTEVCRKFSKQRIERVFSESGFSIEKWFTDPKGWFSLVQVKTKTDGGRLLRLGTV
jgi:L-histidine N-alpha-methyltransferase